jgi:peptidoglycan/xylan/chitin deacetylase (PgdA/CDA1 family)
MNKAGDAVHEERTGGDQLASARPDLGELLAANHPERFWGVPGAVPHEVWEEAARAESRVLPGSPLAHDPTSPVRSVLRHTLGEEQFGPDRYRLGRAIALYYRFARPVLPAAARPLVRRTFQARKGKGSSLGWPIEDRFVRYQEDLLARVASLAAASGQPFQPRPLWPDGRRFALILTHDVETRSGHDHVRAVMALERELGFRSCFNFVPEDYRVDDEVLEALAQHGFEVGVHGLKHDGTLFASAGVFADKAARVNGYAKGWGAVGFRSPMTHRQPLWMQALDIEYDSSFFDTDPYEPMPGGTMSIWPFALGRFIELPYTLSQDHTLTSTLGETSARLWLEKVEFIADHAGMALLNTHPDYLREPATFDLYRSFLVDLRARRDFWHALPREAAAWWRARLDDAASSTP